MASSLSLFSPSSSLTHNRKHHVFPSFHGSDVRRGFLSHFLKEFKRKGIDPFIDNDIERSKSIGPELIEAIRGSRIAIVLLSKNYASSTWCLDELVQIIKCREEFGQTVMVIFYEADPTDVKKQTGDFGKVFIKTCTDKTEEDIQRWKQALGEVATIAGYHSRNWDNEAEMIETIAIDVSNKLNNSTISTDFDNIVGMDSHMINMRPLLLPDLEEVRMIGIWGPSGIGKTTIARCLFNQYSQDFQLSVFMDSIKRLSILDHSDDYSVKLNLQETFMSKIINHDGLKIPHLGVVKDRLKDKKVLVIFDDVDWSIQLDAMAKETSWFGPGSRIIITTQDQKILRAGGVSHTYKVGLPPNDEAHEMFCMYAFDQKYPKDGFGELVWEVTSLAGKLPLGLRVMGSYFRGLSNKEDWEKALARLKTRLDGDIESILKFSYDSLHDEDKSLFLHIACFFDNESVDTVEGCLANSLSVSDVTHGLNVLTEKSLIFYKDKAWVSMQDLLIQLGREIVRKQSINEPGKREFLVDIRDVTEVLGDDKADCSNVIGIHIWIKEDIPFISEGVFEQFYNLQFLKIVGACVNLRSLNFISRKLRYLRWDQFPLPCFPSDFQPKFLVRLRMHFSNLKKLWEGIQPLKNLKWMDLAWSKCLKVLPDLSTAVNLCQLNLSICSSLVKLPSIGNAIHLQSLGLQSCSSLVKLHPSIGNAIHLRALDLGGCFSLVELPSSIGNLINLEVLFLRFCSRLVELPSSIANLTKLEELDLQYCERLVALPSSIGNLINLKRLDLSYCRRLVKLPLSMKNLCRLSKLGLVGCSELELCLTNINLESLEELNLSYGTSLKPSGTAIEEVPSSMMRSWPLLSETQELAPWIGRISRLRQLELNDMQKLVSLPQLPYSVEELVAVNCVSLERLECSFRNPKISLYFANCFKLNQEARDLIIQTPTSGYAVLPGGEVPACFTYRASGSSLTVKLNQNSLCKSTKFRACIILAGKKEYDYGVGKDVKVYCSITSKQSALAACISNIKPLYSSVFLEHLYTFEVEAMEVTSTELVFEFVVRYFDVTWTVKECYSDREIKECGIFQLDREASGE